MSDYEAAEIVPDGVRTHDGLIAEIKEMIAGPENGFKEYKPGGAFPGLRPPGRKEGRAAKKQYSLVMAEDTGVELGQPSTQSASLFLWTCDDGAVPEGIWIAAPEFKAMKGRPVPYAQVVVAQMRPGIDPAEAGVRSLMTLTNRIPGCMTRSLQGRIWIRIHRDLVDAGFGLPDIGRALFSVYRDEAREAVAAAGVVLIADRPDLVARIERLQAMARVINGENRKLRLEEDGALECDDLNCGTCNEKPYCDTLREVLIVRRRKK